MYCVLRSGITCVKGQGRTYISVTLGTRNVKDANNLGAGAQSPDNIQKEAKWVYISVHTQAIRSKSLPYTH